MTALPLIQADRLRVAAAAGCSLLCLAAPLGAEPIPLAVPFEPLEVQMDPVCVPRPPEELVIARWSAWAGEELGDRPPALIRRDLRILREADAAAWFDTIAKAADLLLEADPDYGERDWLMDRIELALAAGRPEIVQEEGLTERLLRAGIETSPGAQYFAAELLRDGVGYSRDEVKAQELLIAAAYGGNSDALMELAALTSDGTQIEGWDIDPTLAVTLAFGGLIGEADALVCDRINRIASAYRLGEVVQQDMSLAERWYRLSASLGDFNAAWQVAQMHLRAEGLAKDNEVLLAHLQQAADGGLPYAQAELGRIYEVGALVPQDLDLARSLYEAATATRSTEGLVRLASFIRDMDAPTPADLQRRREVLQQLTEQPEPPAWALVELGDLILDSQGRWAGEAEAQTLYRRALEVSPGDAVATTHLAMLELGRTQGEEEFRELTSRLQEVVLSKGGASVMDLLAAAFTCRSPAAPEIDHAAYWRRMREDAGSAPPASSVAGTMDPLALAQVQSEAVAGRASAYALAFQQGESLALPEDAELLKQQSQDAETGPLTELARLELGIARLPEERAAALDRLRAAVAEGEGHAQEVLLDALIADGISDEEVDEVRALAEELAAKGNGLALEALVALEGNDEVAQELVWSRYEEVIETRGDFEALLLAIPFLQDATRQDEYAVRARSVVPCNTPSALRMAEALHDLGRQDAAERWLDIALATSGSEGWQVVAVADAVRQISTRPEATQVVVDLLNGERAKGNRLALLRLATLAQDGTAGWALPDEDLASLYVDLIEASAVEEVPNVLRRLRRTEVAVQARVEAQIDVRGLYEQAAEAGSAVGQLELAKIVQTEADSQTDLAEYARLLTAAAEQGEPEAMYLLSTAYSFGLGVEPSLESSRDWLFRAAEAGDDDAVETVRLLQTQGITQ